MSLKYISDYAQLDNILGDEFVLFCGSAISAKIYLSRGIETDFLPMVGPAIEAFYLLLNSSVNKNNLFGNVLSEYTKNISLGQYKRLMNPYIKFEEFIWRVEQAVGKEKMPSLIENYFLCENNQYNHNHFAIGKLLNSGRAIGCLSTNFDNGIEKANSKVKPIDNQEASNITNFSRKNILIKLHGDATSGNYIATSPALISAEMTHSYKYLESLLKGRTILFLGYSGTGDVDISPYLRLLRDSETKLIFCVKPGEKGPDDSEMATHWFRSNLYTETNENILLYLAKSIAWLDYEKREAPKWNDRLKEWFNLNIQNNEIVNKLIFEFFEEKEGWPFLHLTKVKYWEIQRNNNHYRNFDKQFELGKAYDYIGAYCSCLHCFNKIQSSFFQTEDEKAELIFWRGFAYWLIGKLDKAYKETKYFREINESIINKITYEKGIRLYLDVVRDKLNSITSFTKRMKFYESESVKTICDKVYLSEGVNEYANKIRATLIILDIDRLIGKEVYEEEIQNLYIRAVIFTFWPEAALAVQTMLRINKTRAKDMMIELYRKRLNETKGSHSIKYDFLAYLDQSIANKRIPLSYWIFCIMSSLQLLYIEILAFIFTLKWKYAYNKLLVRINKC